MARGLVISASASQTGKFADGSLGKVRNGIPCIESIQINIELTKYAFLLMKMQLRLELSRICPGPLCWSL